LVAFCRFTSAPSWRSFFFFAAQTWPSIHGFLCPIERI
jgi:hypothetical protein